MAPKSLPHSITPPGLSVLFPGRKPAPVEQAPPSEAPAPAVTPAPQLTKLEPLTPVGEGSTPAAAPAPVTAEPKLEVVAPVATPATPPVRTGSVRKMSRGVRVTQPEIEGKPKGRHTLVIDEMVLEELGLLAWAENMSVSAIAREAFDAYLSARRKAVGQARELRDSFGRKREAV